MKRRILSIVVATALAAMASPAFSSSVELTGFTYGPAAIATVESAAPGKAISPFAVYAGQYSGTLDGKSFVSYCVELTQYLSFNRLYTDYSIVNGVDAWGAAKSAQFDRVISALFGANVNSSPDGSALVQAAIWETLYETAPAHGFASGSFDVTGWNSLASTLATVDWSSIDHATTRYHVDLLSSPSAQDLLLISAASVPEPASVALMIAGLLGLGLVTKRRALQRPTGIPAFAGMAA